jgi:hypothetical protein
VPTCSAPHSASANATLRTVSFHTHRVNDIPDSLRRGVLARKVLAFLVFGYHFGTAAKN